MREGAVLKRNVCIDSQNASCVCIINSISFEIAHVHLKFRLGQGSHNRYFAIGLSKDAANTRQTKGAHTLE